MSVSYPVNHTNGDVAVNFLPVGAGDCMVGISPPGGRIPLRLRPGLSIGLEPLIKVCGLLHKQYSTVMKIDNHQQVTMHNWR